MAKLTKGGVLDLLDEFTSIEKKIATADKTRYRDMTPLIIAHNEACKPILEKFEKSTAPLVSRRSEIQEEVFKYLEQQGKDQIILSESGAVAEQRTETKIGCRVIDPQRFFDTVKAKGTEFWNCLKVEIAKAEKFLGKTTVDDISDKKETTTVSRTLRVK